MLDPNIRCLDKNIDPKNPKVNELYNIVFVSNSGIGLVIGCGYFSQKRWFLNSKNYNVEEFMFRPDGVLCFTSKESKEGETVSECFYY